MNNAKIQSKGAPADWRNIIDQANQAEALDQQEISELTQLILAINPAEVDDLIQAKLNGIMSKVRNQFA